MSRLRHPKPETKEEQRGEANRDGLLYRTQRYIDRKRKREKGVAREREIEVWARLKTFNEFSIAAERGCEESERTSERERERE